MTDQRRRGVPKPKPGHLSVAILFLLVAGAVGLVFQMGDQPGPADLPPGKAVAPVTRAGALPFASDGVALPRKLGSLRFAVMGDTGRGDRAQYDTANEMARWRTRFDFKHVLMLGDNIYAAGTAKEYAARFERPYKALTDAGVLFHAVLGNHDPPGQTSYPPFNMQGHRYYSFTLEEGPLPVVKQQIAFFALDTTLLDGDQLVWLDRELGASKAAWKICFYHHPLYTSGQYSLSAVALRRALEPIFVAHGVEVGFSGHEHFYERMLPERGVQYFTSGSGGALRPGGLRRTSLTAAGFDRDNEFMLIEISGDTFYFQAISRTGETIDAGQIERVTRASVR